MALVSTAGTVIERFNYDAYGVPTVLSAVFAVTTDVKDWETRYASYRWDKESALYLARNRYHHSLLGRWLSRDPSGYQSNKYPNLYAYVDDNPASNIDPFGLVNINPNWPRWLLTAMCGLQAHIDIQTFMTDNRPPNVDVRGNIELSTLVGILSGDDIEERIRPRPDITVYEKSRCRAWIYEIKSSTFSDAAAQAQLIQYISLVQQNLPNWRVGRGTLRFVGSGGTRINVCGTLSWWYDLSSKGVIRYRYLTKNWDFGTKPVHIPMTNPEVEVPNNYLKWLLFLLWGTRPDVQLNPGVQPPNPGQRWTPAALPLFLIPYLEQEINGIPFAGSSNQTGSCPV
ncbi:MAG TPA: RHS repeat-associated core domain-containing protein [Pirellulales bacterium]|nr:RHS repeat-associated core domain-containing protein [Pirellulales bacterium]